MKQTTRALAFFLATTCLAPDALALDGAGYLALIKTQAARQEATIAQQGVEDAGEGSFVIRGFSRTGGDASALRIESMRFDGARAIGEGGYSADAIAMTGISFSRPDPEGRKIEVTAGSLEIVGGYWPARGAELPPAGRSQYTVSDATLAIDGAQMGTIARMVATMTVEPDGNTITLQADAPLVTVATDAMPEDAKAQLTQLGLMPLELAASLKAKLDSAGGRLSVDAYRIAMRNAGAAVIRFELEGMTQDWLERTREIRQRPVAASPEARDADSAQMTEALRELRLVSASLRFEDDGVVRRALAIQADAMGLSQEDAAAFGAQLAGERLNGLAEPALAASASPALQRFLADPRSLTLLLSPASPTAITDLVGDAIASMPKLVERLGLAIEVNGRSQ